MKVIKNVSEYDCGKATCLNCGSELEYEETDIINKDMIFGCDYEGTIEYEVCKVVICHVCKHNIYLGLA